MSQQMVHSAHGPAGSRARQALQIVGVIAAVQVIVIITTSSQRLIEAKDMDARRVSVTKNPFRNSYSDVRLEDGIRGGVASLVVHEQCPDPRLGLTVVTAATSDQFMNLVELMRSLEDSEMALVRDCLKFLIFDLGLSSDQRNALDQGLLPLGSAASVRSVNMSSWPAHLSEARARGPNKGWKPLLLLEAAGSAKGGFILWLDAGSVVHSRLAEVRRWLRDYGFVATLSSEGQVRQLTHPGMLKYFGINTGNATAATTPGSNEDNDASHGHHSTEILGQPILGGGLIGFDTSLKKKRTVESAQGNANVNSISPMKILNSWAQCSLVQSCIAPSGAKVQNHRFERSSLSVLVYQLAPELPTMPFGEELGVSAAFTAQGEKSGYELQVRCPDGPTLTVALAVAQDYFSDVMRLITALNAYEAACIRLVVYTMELRGAEVKLLEQRLSRQHRYLKKLDFSGLPPHMDLPTNTNAWRAVVLESVLREFGGKVVFLDRVVQVEGSLDGVRDRLTRDGFVSLPSLGTVSKWTHPATLAALDIKTEALSKGNLNTALVGFDGGNQHVMSGIFRPYYDCCLDKACVMPPGATRRNHHFEQAVLSAIAANYGAAAMPGPSFLRVSVSEDELDLEFEMCMFPHEASMTVATTVTNSDLDLWGMADFARYIFSAEQNAVRFLLVDYGLSAATIERLASIFELMRANAHIVSVVGDGVDTALRTKANSLSKQALALAVAAERFPDSPILYLDTFCRVLKPLRKVRQTLQSTGMVALPSADQVLDNSVPEAMFAQLDPQKQTFDHPVFRSDILGFDLSNATVSSVFSMWTSCAQDSNCASSAVFESMPAESQEQSPASDAPNRSSLRSRQDVVALSIIAHREIPSLSSANLPHGGELHIQFNQNPVIKGSPDEKSAARTAELRLNNTRLLRPLCQTEDE